jgi:hypothetical protein
VSEERGKAKAVVPVSGDYTVSGADVPRAMREYHDSLEANVLTGTEGRLLIAQPGDVARFKAMSGDVSINASGVTQIGNNKIASGMVQEAAILEAKIADSAVTSRKFKPTSGIVVASGSLVLTTTYQDIPGLSLEVTPAVASKLNVMTTSLLGNVTEGVHIGLKVDGEAEDLGGIAATTAATITTVHAAALTAAKHTVKVRAKLAFAGSGELTPICRLQYLLVAS